MKLAIALSFFILLVGWCAGRPAQSPATLANGEPVVTIVPTGTPTVAPVIFPTPGAPQRVQFERGSYGATLTGNNSQAFLLWAASGQKFTAYLMGAPAQMSLRGVDGGELFNVQPQQSAGEAILPANGDYTLIVSATVPYTVGIEIR